MEFELEGTASKIGRSLTLALGTDETRVGENPYKLCGATESNSSPLHGHYLRRLTYRGVMFSQNGGA